MTLEELPAHLRLLPSWVRNDEIRWLSRRPWVAAFVRDLDYSLEPAIARFKASQSGVSIRGADGATGAAADLLAIRGDVETTALRSAPVAVVTRGVRICSPFADHIKGLAVPFNERSVPVRIMGGITCLEQFDRRSFKYLPPSTDLRDSHDWSADPVGRVTSLRHTPRGVAIEARIDRDPCTWIKRWIAGEHSSLSISFTSSPMTDDWGTWRGFPLRTVRYAELCEVSLVRSPAYANARIIEAFDRIR